MDAKERKIQDMDFSFVVGAIERVGVQFATFSDILRHSATFNPKIVTLSVA